MNKNCDPIELNDLPLCGPKMSGTNNFMNLKNQHEDSEAYITLAIPFIKFGKTGIDFCVSNGMQLSAEISTASGQHAALQ